MSASLPFDQLVIQRAATFSECGRYRYALSRHWGDPHRDAVGWIMLNPSTADAEVDDPTIRKCMRFAHAWGYRGIRVANLFNLRATDPDDLAADPHPDVPPGYTLPRQEVLRILFGSSAFVVAAWSSHAIVEEHRAFVRARAVAIDRRCIVHCLDVCKDGSPRHPLYVRGDTKPRVWFDGQTAKEPW